MRTKTSASAGTYRFSTVLLIDRNPRTIGFDLDDNEQSSLLHSDTKPESLQHRCTSSSSSLINNNIMKDF